MPDQRLESFEAEYRTRTPRSQALLESAQKVIPGGFSQGSRFFAPYPFYCARAEGARVQDVDGNWYTDYWLAAGANILGHSHPAVLEAVRAQMPDGCNFGIPYPHEVELARAIIDLVPCAEQVKFVNSGMDACLLGIRAARAFTGRLDVGVFEGHFHGWEDQLYTGYAKAIGVPPGVQQNMIVFPFNDLDAVAKEIKQRQFAAILLEPYSTNCGAIMPRPGFLQELKRLCSENGIVLIFDEVVTNFRFAVGGAQQYFGVTPDLAALGKGLTGGFSTMGALAGRADILQVTDQGRPGGYVYYGTWMTPVVTAAAKATLALLADGTLIEQANRRGDRLRAGLDDVFRRAGIAAQNVGIGSVVRTHFTDRPIVDLASVRHADKEKLARFHLGLVNRGHFILPGKNAYVSLVTSDAEIDRLLQDADYVARRLSK